MSSKILLKSLIVNLFLTIVKFIGSVLGNSKTLISDAVHSFSDMSTDIIGLIGDKLSSKKPDKEHPYGHGRIEYLTSIIMSFFIIWLGLSIMVTSFNGKIKVPNKSALVVIGITIVIKFILSTYLLKKGKEMGSNIVLANGVESRYDMYNSILGFVFILISFLGSDNKYFKYADIIGSVVIAFMSIKVGIEILLKNVSSILGEVETDKNKINSVKEIIRSNLYKIRRVTLIKYGHYYDAIIDLILKNNININEVYKLEQSIKKELKRSDMSIRYVTVNFKPKNKKM